MDPKLCRLCGKHGYGFTSIFATPGLKYKIETCLPIIVSPHCLLPETICPDCLKTIENFYVFVKNCLESIIILESKLDIQGEQSCLKTKRKNDKSCLVSLPLAGEAKCVQTDDPLEVLLGASKEIEAWTANFPLTTAFLTANHQKKALLVDYEVFSDSSLDNTDNNSNSDQIILKKNLTNAADEAENPKKRKSDTNCHSECGNKRKCSKPKKLEKEPQPNVENEVLIDHQSANPTLHDCLLCNAQLETEGDLGDHFVKCHAQEYVQTDIQRHVLTNGEKKMRKTLPSLLKISDLRRSETNQSNILCPLCSTPFTCKEELFFHLQLKHMEVATFLCGICLTQFNSLPSLQEHLQNCVHANPVATRYYCAVCYFGENSYRSLETHVLVHNFLLDNCRKEVKNFDPEDYIAFNRNFSSNCATPVKHFTCFECGTSDFETFQKFSLHRRKVHSIFHCDLCSKFYGRNSHLWKHVNRLHKGHPSITCQMCFKTSASKYHLAQHFSKIHEVKSDVKLGTLKQEENTDDDEHFFTDDSVELKPKCDGAGVLKCDQCGKAFHKLILLRKHKSNCRPKLQKDLLTRCKSCTRIFKDRQSLAKHLVNYHSDYVCEICDEKVPSKCEIVTHIRFQHPASHLVCSVCENILRCKQDLLDHLANHEISHVCQFCGDTLSSKVKLKMHILSLHRKILSLSCGICLKLFDNQHVLRDHVASMHKSQLDRLTSCPVCGKNYGSRWKAFDHVNKSHGKVFKACKICLDVYETELELENHITSAHFSQQIQGGLLIKPNPAATVESGGNNGNLRENQNGFVSGSEENTEETENHSQTSDSEEEETQQTDPLKNPMSFEMFSSQGSKISLLEKRLLGQGLNQDPIGDEKPLALLKITKEELKSSGNQTTNHAKRTVYVNSNDPSFCEICHKTWPAKKHLWQHYIRCHKGIAATVCGICLKTNSSYEALQLHLRETHPNLLYGQGFGSNFICRICGRYHNASSKLSLHMAIHQNFDWTLLDKISAVKKEDSDVIKTEVVLSELPNCLVKVKTEIEDMYDDMIEQVEESSSSSEVGTTENKSQESSSYSDNTAKSNAPLTFSNLFQMSEEDSQTRTSAELDSAVKSISVACTQVELATEISNNSLNDKEIESAVAGIL